MSLFTWIDGNAHALVVTINQTGILLNQKAANFFKEVRYVSAGIDYKNKRVAIHPVTKQEIEQNIFSLQQLHKISLGNGYGKISNKALVTLMQQQCEVPLDNIKFKAEYDAENQYLVFSLTSPLQKGDLNG